MPPSPDLPRVLFVDDEPQVLQGIAVNLRRGFQVVTAPSGEAAIQLLRKDTSFSVIVSDMRMPGMNGATFLAQARVLAPASVRMLLTGYSDVQSAIAAVNDGQIFRFMTKPCPAETMTRILHEGLEQYRLLFAEKELLEKTVLGSIKALTDVLSLTNPEAFGRAARVKRVAVHLAQAATLPEQWTLEVAAMASHIGYVSVPPAVVEKVYQGRALQPAEKEMADRAPGITRQILSNIPRLEKVVNILEEVAAPSATMSQAARILRIAGEYDTLDAAGFKHPEIIQRLSERKEELGPRLIELLAEIAPLRSPQREIVKLKVMDLRVGMVLAGDLQAVSGTLLVPRGHEINAGSLARIWNFARSTALKEPIEVFGEPVKATMTAPVMAAVSS
jgi:CheY-like chemotaxis protein